MDTEGKLLTLDEVKSLKDCTELWIESDFPLIMVKQGDYLKGLGDKGICQINDIGTLFTASEYLSKEITNV